MATGSLPPHSISSCEAPSDTVELRLMMAYAKRRRAQRGGAKQEVTSPETLVKTDEETEKKKKKKKKKSGGKHLARILRCIRPQREEEPVSGSVSGSVSGPVNGSVNGTVNGPVQDRCGLFGLDEVVNRLTQISDDVPFVPPEIETDSGEDDVEKVVALLLRDAGDQLNQQLKDVHVSYGFFECLMRSLLLKTGLLSPDPESLGPQASPKVHIAVTCEVATRLSAVDSLPGNRMLSHGARYLQDHHSEWAELQGGYEEAFHSDEEEEEQ